MTVFPGMVTGVDQLTIIGFNAELQPVVGPVFDGSVPAPSRWATLAAFAAMWRRGLQSADRQQPVPDRDLPTDQAERRSWLDRYRASCDEAARWLTHDVFKPGGYLEETELIEFFSEFLNLPLWRHRELLYEIWVLCATIDACEQVGWTVTLNGLSKQHGEWVLSVGRSRTPVATLSYPGHPRTTLSVWREPARQVDTQELTPDVTVSTPSPYEWDLLVVEAKDRVKMSSGLRFRRDRSGDPPGDRSALGVAQRYARGLRPRAVWVCNHCDFRQSASADDNHGNLWTQIHVADQFRPGNVPSAFTESVRAALALPPGLAQGEVSDAASKNTAASDTAEAVATGPDAPIPDPRDTAEPGNLAAGRGLVLVIDVTSSMRSHSENALEALGSASGVSAYRQFRAVLYSDHGSTEPLLVRKVGPFHEIGGLLDAIRPLPSGQGGDADEALEDAIQRCRELVDDIGPQDLLILTDAAPHPVSTCPYHIDFPAEVRGLLDARCRVRVASDWWAGGPTWDSFSGMPGFEFAPLRTLVSDS